MRAFPHSTSALFTREKERGTMYAAQRQSHARPAQRCVQSTLARDLGRLAGSSTSAGFPAEASRQSAAAGAGLLVPAPLANAPASGVSTLPCCCSDDHASSPQKASRCSFWLGLLLAQTVSPTSPLPQASLPDTFFTSKEEENR